jgi:GrpB-like predicted nucleotidyltransferase (UPF0157 family)
MAYGSILKSSATYKKFFNSIKSKIIKASKYSVVEHVGGTSLKTPTGKGDVDIYVGYKNQTHKKELQTILTTLFGKPAKVTLDRARYNLYMDGVEIEIQLASGASLQRAVALRDYLNGNSVAAKQYASSIMKLRQQFLKDMFKVKSTFTEKALHIARQNVKK